jgi:hypothetical protein
VLQASMIYSQFQDTDPSKFMKIPIAPLFELAFSALLAIVQNQEKTSTGFSKTISYVAQTASFTHKIFMIKHINQNLLSITSKMSDSSQQTLSTIVANLKILNQIFMDRSKDTSLANIFCGTILKTLRECVFYCKHTKYSNDNEDWMLLIIKLATDLTISMDFTVAKYVFELVTEVVLALRDRIDQLCGFSNCSRNASIVPKTLLSDSWSIFNSVCDILQRLVSRKMLQKTQAHVVAKLLKTLVNILLDQDLAKYIQNQDDKTSYVDDIQIACDKIKILYNSTTESNLGKFMEHMVFDFIISIATHTAKLPKEDLQQYLEQDIQMNLRYIALKLLTNSTSENSDLATEDASSTFVTLFQSGLHPEIRFSIPKRLNENDLSMKIFNDICMRQRATKNK